ncbi:magnetosome formation protease MamE [Paramagnetospirillum magneticum]|uniref:magnetosome formation protease MamE n=1 Tax=Paramagnetospirillum magneticum TaxID=84159 RepID=UPI00031265DB|nr:magnetosome formation protease MamE [Paramagnetospirillum magneticum]
MFNRSADDEGHSNATRSKELKRYLMLMGVIALIVLFGAFIYRQPSGGLRLESILEQLGHGSSVNLPTQPGAVARLQPNTGGVPRALASSGGGFSNVAALLRNGIVSVKASSPSRQPALGNFALDHQSTTPRFANPSASFVDSVGTGVIVRDEGFIITNFHVVRGAQSVFVTVPDDTGSTRYSAEIVKLDEALDLALLKITPKAQLSVAVLGNSDAVLVADEVIAIGTPFGLDMSVSRGIISAKNKSMVIEGVTHSKLLQTDAAINQGNSGGPLVIANGTVIGINTAIYTPNGAFSGIGFAVPSNQARQFAQEVVGWLPTTTAEGPSMGLVALQGPSRIGVGSAGPPIMARMSSPHTDGRQNLDCANCHEILPSNPGVAAAGSLMPVANPRLPPPIRAIATPPHTDGRQNMACNTCHQIIGAPAGRVAFTQPMIPIVAGQPAGPSIQANAANPHTDGRQSMNCASCHQIVGASAGPIAFVQSMPIVAQQQSGPPIQANAANPHTDGRQSMNCVNCHQIIGAVSGSVAIGQPGLGGYQFAQPPGSLAMNVKVPRGGQAARETYPNHNLLGAFMPPMSQLMGGQINVPAGRGVFITGVSPNTPAAAAGLQAGDMLLKVDGRPVNSAREVIAIISEMPNGRSVRLGILREGSVSNLTLLVGPTAAAPPAPKQNAGAGNNNVVQPAAPAKPAKPPKIPTEFTWMGMEIDGFMEQPMMSGSPDEPPIKTTGAQVAEMATGSRAEAAGVMPNDLILEVNNMPVTTPALLDAAIKAAKTAGPEVLLRVNRSGREVWVVL